MSSNAWLILLPCLWVWTSRHLAPKSSVINGKWLPDGCKFVMFLQRSSSWLCVVCVVYIVNSAYRWCSYDSTRHAEHLDFHLSAINAYHWRNCGCFIASTIDFDRNFIMLRMKWKGQKRFCFYSHIYGSMQDKAWVITFPDVSTWSGFMSIAYCGDRLWSICALFLLLVLLVFFGL